MPYLGPITNAASAPEVELENTEIPVKLGLRFAIESRRFANGLDIPEIETRPVPSEEEVMLICSTVFLFSVERLFNVICDPGPILKNFQYCSLDLKKH